MSSSSPCSACSWTVERQECCRYESHVKIFYECSDRGVWSLGSKFVLKERGTSHRGYEVPNIQFVQEKTSIPVPDVVDNWEEDDCAFTLSRRAPGETLHEAWPKLSNDEKENIAKETAEYLTQLRKLQSNKVQAFGGRPVYCNFLFPGKKSDQPFPSYGPFSSDDELWVEMEKGLHKVPKAARERLRNRMPPAEPYTFTHADLTDVNIRGL